VRSPGDSHASGRTALTVVIPAFNEEARILPAIDRVVEEMERIGEPFEILCVDDGSTDATADRVRRAAFGTRACGSNACPPTEARARRCAPGSSPRSAT